jgi:glycerol-3-phosphate dehydrogenase
MTDQMETDVVIMGAGIAGLWLNQRLRRAGYSTLLFEKDTLGGMQTMRSQGIVHGGTKYTLHGALSNAANAISDMPDRWRTCLQGKGDVDLRGARLLSEHHYMWSRDRLLSKLTSFFASKAIRGKVQAESPPDRPEAFQHPDFQGNFYALNEIVLDLPSVISALSNACADGIYKYDCTQPGTLEFDGKKINALVVQRKNQRLKIRAQRYILTAGEGNESILHTAHLSRPAMQRRPLHMVLVKHRYMSPIYAHCVGSGAKPLLTITTHYMQDGQPVWYLGGNLAETGVELGKKAQIATSKELLNELLPWIDLGETRWNSFMIHRAEPQQKGMLRPDAAFLHSQQNIITCWPTKLALAPNLADAVITNLDEDRIQPEFSPEYKDLGFLQRPKIATPIWEQLLA